MEADNVSYKTLIYSRENIVQVFTGTYSKVTKEVAIKILYFDELERANDVFKEILSMQRFRDREGVAKLYDQSISQREDGKYFIRIVMELYPNGDLKKLIDSKKKAKSRFTEEELFSHLRSIVKNFAHFQKLNLAHRDIKPENIFIGDQNQLIIGDLGCTNETSAMSATIAGTPNYLSPELKRAYISHLSGQQVKLSHNVFKSDVFSLGLTFLYMACLDGGPTDIPVDQSGFEFYFTGKFSSIQKMYPLFTSILKSMLAYESSNRLDFLELASRLSIKEKSKSGQKSESVQNSCSSCRTILSGEIWDFNEVKICKKCVDSFETNKTPPRLYCAICGDIYAFCGHICEICKMGHDKNQKCFEILYQRLGYDSHYCPKCSSQCIIAIRWLICENCKNSGQEKYTCVVCNKGQGKEHVLCVLLMNQRLANKKGPAIDYKADKKGPNIIFKK